MTFDTETHTQREFDELVMWLESLGFAVVKIDTLTELQQVARRFHNAVSAYMSSGKEASCG